MCGPVLRRRLHGVGVDGLHGNWAIGELVEVLHGGLVVVRIVGPGSSVVLIRVRVVVLVVHLQLAHEESRGRLLGEYGASKSGRVRVVT